MSSFEQYLGPGMLQTGPGTEAGIVRTYPDGLMWVVNPDGTRCLLSFCGGGGGGAPADAEYVVMALNATLTDERVLTAGDALLLTDGGAGGPATFDVVVDGVTIGINGSNELEALTGSLTDAVIKAPGSSTRNTITSVGGDFIELPLLGAAAQTAPLFTAAYDGGANPFYKIIPNATAGGTWALGGGTFVPSTYEGFNSLWVLSRTSLVTGGGPAITPSSGVTIPFRVDTQVSPTAGVGTVQNTHSKVVYDTDQVLTGSLSSLYVESSFRGTKAAGTGSQVTGGVFSFSSLADQRSGSTGDLDSLVGFRNDVRARGTGTFQTGGTPAPLGGSVWGIYQTVAASTGNPTIGLNMGGIATIITCGTAGATIPFVTGWMGSVSTSGRAVTLLAGISVGGAVPDTSFGGTGTVEARAINIGNVAAATATTKYAIYSAGGQSLLISGATGVVPLMARGIAAQTGDLQQWQDSTPTVLLAVQADGDLAWNANEFTLGRTGANVLSLTGADLSVNGNLLVDADGFVDGPEISTPATPAANHGRLYFRDSGAGVTQLIALWPSGNTTIVAEDF